MDLQNSEEIIKEAVDWYIENRPVYVKLAPKVEEIIKELLKDNKIQVHGVFSRAKEIDSFEEKVKDSKYNKPIEQLTDLAGIRIIAYVESDLKKISEIIEQVFEIDEKNSVDKSEKLGIDRVGYKSIHYVAKLPEERLKLPENKKFKDCSFEIQIRTILQHAWAEIEHDKDYKFSGELPSHLKRRFKILAGVLELADKEFDSLATEIDKYIESVNEDTKNGKLDFEINSTSLKTYLFTKFDALVRNGMGPYFANPTYEKMLLEELEKFDITNIKGLDELIPSDFETKLLKIADLTSNYKLNFGGIIRNIMLISDHNKYFKNCWDKTWNKMSKREADFLESFGVPVENLTKRYGIMIFKTTPPPQGFLEKK